MKELLNKALEQLKIARVTINPRSLKKQISLFEIEDSQEVEFNGSKTPSKYLPCKQLVDQMMNESLHQAHEIKREFDLYCFEIREFRQRYFPKEYVDVLLYRVELHKSSSKELINSEDIKKNS
jgi:capsid protein